MPNERIDILFETETSFKTSFKRVKSFLSHEWSISNFPCSLTRNTTSHSMENLAFHSAHRWKMIMLPIHPTTSLMHFFLKGWENVLLNLKGNRLFLNPCRSNIDQLCWLGLVVDLADLRLILLPRQNITAQTFNQSATYFCHRYCSHEPSHSQTQNVQPFKEKYMSEVVRIGSITISHLSKPSCSYCVMLYFLWGCRANLKLITLGNERF